MNDYSFGNLLYELRTEKQLSQSELGEMFGVSNKAVSKWEMGISKPRPAMLVDLASFFQISVEELLAGKRSETSVKGSSDEPAPELRFRAEEYHRSRRKKRISLAVLFLSFAVYLLLGIIIIVCGKEDTVLGPILTGVAMLAELVSFILFLVFYAAQKRQKRMMYTVFPERTKEIRQLLAGTARSESRLAKKWGKFYVFFGMIVFSLSISNLVLQLTGSYGWWLLALVASILILGSISLILIRFVNRHKTRRRTSHH